MSGIYGWSYGSGGVHYYRVAEPLRVAALHGVTVDTGQALHNGLWEQFDTVLVHMLWDERASQAWQQCADYGRIRMVLDIDDVMWQPDWAPFKHHYTPDVLKRVIRNIEISHVVTTPSPVIAEWVEQYNPNVWVCQNTVPEWLTYHNMPVPEIRHRNGSYLKYPRYRIGYQGSPSHATDFTPELQQVLWDFIAEHQQWGINFYGEHWADAKLLREYPYTKIRVFPWESSVEKYYRRLSMELGIGPLARTPFNDGKSSLRAVEYAALGVPSIMSAGPAYDNFIVSGVTGWLVETVEDWRLVLAMAANEPQELKKMGQRARTWARESWTTEKCIDSWVDAWGSV